MQMELVVTVFWLYAAVAVGATALFGAMIWRQRGPVRLGRRTNAQVIREMPSRLPPD